MVLLLKRARLFTSPTLVSTVVKWAVLCLLSRAVVRIKSDLTSNALYYRLAHVMPHGVFLVFCPSSSYCVSQIYLQEIPVK